MSDHGHASHHEHDDSAEHRAHGVGKYIAVFLALCLLTTISFLTYFDFWRSAFGDSPGVARTVMFAVACCKASLVILFFMHLKDEADWKYVLTIPASIMSVFLMVALIPDVGLRTHHYSEAREAAAPNAADTAAMIHATDVVEEKQQHSDEHKSGH